MQKLGDVVIPMRRNKIEYLINEQIRQCIPLTPYDVVVCEFLNELSKLLRNDKEAKKYPDILSFAYWARKGNIQKLKDDFKEEHFRLGRGIVFHIAPSNIPINFAFTFAFGLLAGNGNIVRIPTKEFKQIKIVIEAIKKCFEMEKFRIIKDQTLFVRYEKDDELTKMMTDQCHARVIWGGDQTIQNIKKIPIRERGIEIAFADRFSMAMINADVILKSTAKEVSELALKFYNDTYLIDQNACSSPQIILWRGEDIEKGKKVFWEAVFKESENYDLADVKVIDKFTELCHKAIDRYENIENIKCFQNRLMIVKLKTLPSNLETYRGKFGLFYEYHLEDLNELVLPITLKYQTLTYFGENPKTIFKFVQEHHLLGIDRIVPIGKALEIDVIWDGYDIIKNLSRIISVQ